MSALLAYHLDGEIHSVTLKVGLPLALLVVTICVALGVRLPVEAGKSQNPAARYALLAAFVVAPPVLLAPLMFAALVLPALLPLAVFAYSIVAVRRVPTSGRKAEALGALALSGLLAAYIVGYATACIVVDGCFH